LLIEEATPTSATRKARRAVDHMADFVANQLVGTVAAGSEEQWVLLDAKESDVPEDLASAWTLLHANGLLRQHDGGVQLDLRAALRVCAQRDDLPPPRRHVARSLHSLLRWSFPPESCGREGVPSLPHALPLAAPQLYAQLERYAREYPARPSVTLPPLPALRPTLRQYQREAVEWMVGREIGLRGSTEAVPQFSTPDAVLWRKLSLRAGAGPSLVAVYWNLHSGALLPPGETPPSDADVRGGILADEMGLGKSVEIIALLLAHRRATEPATNQAPSSATAGQAALGGGAEEEEEEEVEGPSGCFCGSTPRGGESVWVQCDVCRRWCHAACAGFASEEEAEAVEGYTCLVCASEAGGRSPLACGATLLVCPASILGQWRDEVERHVGANGDSAGAGDLAGDSARDGGAPSGNNEGRLKVCTYVGLKTALADAPRDARSLAACHPSSLANCDLVLTTFEALRHELHHTDANTPGGISLPRPQRSGGGGGSAYARPSGQGARGELSSRGLLRSPLLSLRWWRLVIDEAQVGRALRTQAHTYMYVYTYINKCIELEIDR